MHNKVFQMVLTILIGVVATAVASSPDPALGSSRSRQCAYVNGSWHMVPFDGPIVLFKGRTPYFSDTNGAAMQECNARWVKGVVRNDERLIMGGSFTVEGGICRPVPKFVIYGIYQLADIYRATEAMNQRVAAAIAVAVKQCGRQPEGLHIVARKVKPLSHEVDHAVRSGKISSAPFEYADFYSGRVDLRKGLTIVNDDAEQDANYWRGENRRRDAQIMKREEDDRKFAIGALLGMMSITGALHSNTQ